MPIAEVSRYMRIYMPRNEQDYLDKYDVVLLSDAYQGAFTHRQQGWFRDSVVEQGVGLVMVGGLDSYADTSRPGSSWEDTPVEEALPVEIPPTAPHWNFIMPYIRSTGAKIRIDDYDHEFMASLPFEPAPRYTWIFNGQIVYPKAGSHTMARYIIPEHNYPPVYTTWDLGKGRSFAMMHDWSFDTEFSRWEYYGDFAINLILYVAQRTLPRDYTVVHEYRRNVHTMAIGRQTVISLIFFVESFGGNAREIDEEVINLDSMVLLAGEHYLDQDYPGALLASEAALEKMKSIEELAIRVKNRALLWVYVVEWLSVTGVSLLSGFVVWTLMVRRRLYREVGVTRLGKQGG
jgi:uncharacterized membrane protein